MSLKEMSEALPDVVDNSVPYDKWKSSQDAKRSMGLQTRGEAARLNFDPEGAHNLFNQAGEAAESIKGPNQARRCQPISKGRCTRRKSN